MLAYFIGCVLLGSAATGVVLLVYRRGKRWRGIEHDTARTHLECQTPGPTNSHGAVPNSKSPTKQSPAKAVSIESETSPLLLVQHPDGQSERPFNQTNELRLPISTVPSQLLGSDETRRDEGRLSPSLESTRSFPRENHENSEIGEAALDEPEEGAGTTDRAESLVQELEIHSDDRSDEEPRIAESHDTKTEESQYIEDHDQKHGSASPQLTSNVPASNSSLPEIPEAKAETAATVAVEAAGPGVVDRAGLGMNVLDAGLTPAGTEETTLEEDKAPKERKPRKYQGLARSAPQPQDNAGQTGHTERGSSTLDRSLPLAVRLRFDPDGFCNVSLIAKRAENSPEEIYVDTPSGRMRLGAIHEDWYQDVVPDEISRLLRDGTIWTQVSGNGRSVWSLSGRELFVLADRHDISGYVSQPCMDIGRKHVVLCTENIKCQVEKAIEATGANAAALVDESLGAPPGWIAFRDVVPTTAVSPLSEADAFNALRPAPHVEISFEEGIRIEYANWLEGHPPLIHVYGDPQHTSDVRIDGQSASVGAAGDYRAPEWDSVGSHSVWCAGTNKSYSIVPFTASWERWRAYEFPVFFGSADKISICGPLVQFTTANAQRAGISLVVPETNPILIGAAPGDYVIAHRVSDVRATSLIAYPPFRPVWALPSDPINCDKQEIRILLINHEPPGTERRPSTLLRNTADEPKLNAWVHKILDAGRKGLRTKPDTDAVWSLWLSYKRLARSIWRARR